MMQVNEVIIYDGQCRFCTHFASWSKMKYPDINIIPVKTKEARSILKTFGVQFVSLQTIYFITQNKVYTKSTAVFHVLKNIHYPWKLIALFRVLPTRITDLFYDLFAKYRHRF